MAVDTTSPLLDLLLQGTGNNNNSWGANLNAQVFLLLEQAVVGQTSVDLSAGNVTLSNDSARSATIVLSGAITADTVVTVPARKKQWKFFNLASGNFFVLVKTASGNPVNAPLGKFVDIISDGSGALYRGDRDRVGELFYHSGTTVPAGSIECNNASLKRLSAVDLYSVIGTTWGTTDSTDFKVPPGTDTGRYIRSRYTGVPVGTLQTSQNKAHTHTGSGVTSGQSVGHTHTFSGVSGIQNQSTAHVHNTVVTTIGGSGGGYDSGAFSTGPVSYQSDSQGNVAHNHSFSGTTSAGSADHTHTFSLTTSGGSGDGTDARPESLVGILCVRY